MRSVIQPVGGFAANPIGRACAAVCRQITRPLRARPRVRNLARAEVQPVPQQLVHTLERRVLLSGTGSDDTGIDPLIEENPADALRSILDTLGQLGNEFSETAAHAIQQAAGNGFPSTGDLSGVPFVSESLERILDLEGSLRGVIGGLLNPALLEADAPPSSFVVDAAPVVIQIDNGFPVGVELTADATDLAGLVADLNASLVDANLGDRLAFVASSSMLSLTAVDAAGTELPETFTLSTLRLDAPDAAPSWGQPGSDVSFEITLVTEDSDAPDDASDGGTTTHGPVTIKLPVNEPAADPGDSSPKPFSADNVNAADLAIDLNLALQNAQVNAPTAPDAAVLGALGNDLLATVDDGKLVLVSTNPRIKEIHLSGGEAALGFTNNQLAQESAMPAADLGLSGGRAVAVPAYDLDLGEDAVDPVGQTLDALRTALANHLGISETALNWQYDPAEGMVTFDLDLQASYSQKVDLDFTDGLTVAGADLPLEFAATTQADLIANVGLDLRLGLDLSNLTASLVFDASTPLDVLNNGEGISLLVGLTADNPAPSDGTLMRNERLTLLLNGGPASGGSEINVDVLTTDTLDNTSVRDLVSDLNASLAAADLGGRIAAGRDGNRITLRAVDREIRSLSVQGATALGFGGSQHDSYADLRITVGGGSPVPVNLSGSGTLGEVRDAIKAAVPGVSVTIDAAGRRLLLSAGGSSIEVAPEQIDGVTSPAAFNLGIAGSAGSGEVLQGRELSGKGLADRLFIVAPESDDPAGLTVDLSVTADTGAIDLAAALGPISLNVTNPQAFAFSLSSGLHLQDPGTSETNDGRIHLREVVATHPGELVDLSDPVDAQLDGTLALSGHILTGEHEGELGRINFSLADTDDPTSVTVSAESADFTNLLDQFEAFSFEQVLSIAREFIGTLDNADEFPLLNVQVPLLNTSLGEALSVADQLLDAIDNIAGAEVDLPALQAARDHVQAAITNLPIPTAQKQDLYTALTAVNAAVNGRGDPARLPGRLLAGMQAVRRGAIELTEGPEALLDSANAQLQQLQKALDDLEAIAPSLNLNALAGRVESAMNEMLPGDPVSFDFDVVDYDHALPGEQLAVVAALQIDAENLAQVMFHPELLGTSYGPIDLGITSEVALRAGLSLDLGFGVNLADPTAPQSFIVVDSSAGLTSTQLRLNAGFAGQINGGVSFGALAAVQAEGDIALGHPDVVGDPLDAGNMNPAQMSDRASITFDFDPASASGNSIGAVAVTDLLGGGVSPRAQIEGEVAAGLDVNFLGSRVDDAVTLRSSLEDLIHSGPTIEVDEAALEDLFVNVDFDLTTIVAGIDALLDLIETGLTEEVVTSLPLVGEGFDAAGTFVGDLRRGLTQPFLEHLQATGTGGTFEAVEASVRTFLFDKLTFLGLLAPASGASGPLDPERDVYVDVSAERFEIGFRIAGRDEVAGVDFSSGMAGLPLEADGGMTVGWGYDIDFGIGISRSSGAYLLTNSDPNDPEIEMELGAGLAVDTSGPAPQPTRLTLDLFGLQISATDNSDGATFGTGVVGGIDLDIEGGNPATGTLPNGDAISFNRLAMPDLVSKPFHDVFGVEAGLNAKVDLALEAGTDGDLPSISADLFGGWGLGLSNASGTMELTFDDQPSIGFQNVALELGGFISGYIGPPVKFFADTLEPVKPLIDLLNSEVPGVSDISQAAGKGPVKVIDLALMQTPEAVEPARQFLNVAATVLSLAGTLDVLGGDEVVISFGDFGFGPLYGNTLDITASDFDAAALDAALADSASGFLGVAQQALDAGNAAVEGALSTLSANPSSGDSDDSGLGIEFSFLQPENIFRFLIGQTVDVIRWDIPRLDLNFEWTQSFPVWPIPPIALQLGLGFDAFVDLGVGYDTRGVQTGNFIDGFYFSDLELTDDGFGGLTTGGDIAEFGLGMDVSLAAALDLGLAAAGVRGGIRGEFDANFRDTDNDGRMYLDEIGGIAQTDGLECLFDLSARLRAIVSVFYEVRPLGPDGEFDLVDFVLFEIDNSELCPKLVPAHVSEGGEALPDGTISKPGQLILHAGAFAAERGGGASDTDEAFTVTEVAPGVYEVEALGLTGRYVGVESIFFNGGAGNDALATYSEAGDFDVLVTAYGGMGEDTLQGSTGADSLVGGEGADVIDARDGDDDISGGTGSDEIDAGDGDNTVVGGAGNDTVNAGTGSDLIDTGAGNDSVLAGSGNDTIAGGIGQDFVDGGDGHDSINAGGGNDTVLAGEGNDTVSGGAGRDSLAGGQGNDGIDGGSDIDTLEGDSGHDTLRGSTGNDSLDGGSGDDEILGNNGNDLLVGGAGTDSLIGGWGNDVLLGHLILNPHDSAGDRIEGGPDDDFICGTDGMDEIYGGTSQMYLAQLLADGLDVPTGPGGYVMESCEAIPEPIRILPARIIVRKFNDADADGTRDADESYVNGQQIELYDEFGTPAARATTADVDLNGDGVIDVNTERGVAVFDQLPPGAHEVREVLGGDTFQTMPDTGGFELNLISGETAEMQFGNAEAGRIEGTKWDDADRDGRFDSDENPLQGVTVYLDQNDNAVLDENEPIVETDEEGSYVFDGLQPGRYVVREVVPEGQRRTFPRDGQLIYENDFSSDVGSEWSDRRVTQHGDHTFLGTFDSDTVRLELNGLPSHDFITLEFDLYIIGGWEGEGVSGIEPSPDRWLLEVLGSGTLLDATFSNVHFGEPQFVQAFPISSEEGVYPPGTGAHATGSLGFEAGLDSIYRLRYTFRHDSPLLRLGFTGDSLEAATAGEQVVKINEVWGLDNVVVSIPGGKHLVDLGQGEISTGNDFGNTTPRGDLIGRVIRDDNGDRQASPGEAGINHRTVYLLDSNNGTVVDTAVTATVDLNGDGEIDLRTEQGVYRFIGLEPGVYEVAYKVRDGYRPTTEPSAEVVISDAGATEQDFFIRPLPADIGGTVFHDPDRDGVQDADEPGIGGVNVFLDTNANGVADHYRDRFGYDGRQGQPDRFTTIHIEELGGTDAETITDLNLVIDLMLESRTSSIRGVLISPAGTEVLLFDIGSEGTGRYVVMLDDDAKLPAPDGPTDGGTYQPLHPLDRLNGEHGQGTWALRLETSDILPTVTVNRWSMDLEVAEPSTTTAADGSYSFTDVAPGLVHVVHESPTNLEPTLPNPDLGPAVYVVPVRPGRAFREVDFGNAEPAPDAEVVGRHLFYNNSSFDNPNAGRNDDDAIAPDKQALLPGQKATFANYTSYSRGINGLMIDVADLADVPALDDFIFRVGNDSTPEDWTDAPTPSSITVREGAGLDGADRITITWPDLAIAKQWLEVTVLPTDATGLATADLFYFGNAIGETGNGGNDTFAFVDATDAALVRNNTRSFLNPAGIDFNYDFNRDQRVDAIDAALLRNNVTSFFSALRLIQPQPPVGESSTSGTATTDPVPVVGDEGGAGGAENPYLPQGTWTLGSWKHRARRFADSAPPKPNLPSYTPGPLHQPVAPVDPLDGSGGDTSTLDIQEMLPPPVIIGANVGGALYDLDLDTAGLTDIRLTEPNLIGISRSPVDDTYVGITTGGEIYSINPDSGSIELLSDIGLQLTEGAIDFSPTGTLYMITETTGGKEDPQTLYEVNLQTGSIVPRLVLSKFVQAEISAMAFGGENTLFALTPTELLEFDLSTNTLASRQTLFSDNSPLGAFAGMDFDVDGTLVVGADRAVRPQTGVLFRVDVATGQISEIGQIPLGNSGLNIDPQNYVLRDGSDTIHAGLGDDLVWGDNVVTEPRVVSEGLPDTLMGGRGNDTLFGQQEDDLIWGADDKSSTTALNDGDDVIDGGSGSDILRQVVDNDQDLTDTTLTGQGTDSHTNVEEVELTGGTGDNAINASAYTGGPVTLQGMAGNDSLTGGAKDDLLEGGIGNDLLEGGDGNDTYAFGTVSDGLEDDEIRDASGRNTIDFSALPVSDPVSIDFTSETLATHTGRTLKKPASTVIDHATGGAGNDRIVGNGRDNVLVGGRGDDTVNGGAGNDTLEGGHGSDTLAGGSGKDLYRFDAEGPSQVDEISERASDVGIDTLDFSNLGFDTPVVVTLDDTTGGPIASYGDNKLLGDTDTARAIERAIGGEGDDVFHDNNATSNTFIGGRGDDAYRFGNPIGVQSDTVVELEGEGNDTLDLSLITDSSIGMRVNLSGLSAATDTVGHRKIGFGDPSVGELPAYFENVLGGAGDDEITGTTADNYLAGGGGDDTLRATSGDDTLSGGNGNDSLDGGTGSNLYRFEDDFGHDVLNDFGSDVDTVDFSAVTPEADGTGVFVNLAVAAGGALAQQGIVSGIGATNSVTAVAANVLENAVGSDGNDVLFGSSAANTLLGGAGDDIHTGGGDGDILAGGTGNDIYLFGNVGSGNEAIVIDERPGEGVDGIAFSTSNPVSIDLSDPFVIATQGGRLILPAETGGGINLENVSGGGGDDTIVGNAADNLLSGGAGNDYISADGGNDTLIGGAGTNTLSGGAGDDIYQFVDSVTATDTLIEDSGAVTPGSGLARGGGSDTLNFAAFTVGLIFDLRSDTHTVDGASGNTTTINLRDSFNANASYFENITAGQSDDVLVGSESDNVLDGGDGSDTIYGLGGNDTLRGQGGEDVLFGDNPFGGSVAGDDVLVGGADEDALDGGSGRDLFIGGEGDDLLYGQEGDDILIGGTTAYDDNDGALRVLLDTWTRTDLGYSDRIALLTAGVGSNPMGNPFRLTSATIFDDGITDRLKGGTGRDWFFQNSGDILEDDEPDETITGL